MMMMSNSARDGESDTIVVRTDASDDESDGE